MIEKFTKDLLHKLENKHLKLNVNEVAELQAFWRKHVRESLDTGCGSCLSHARLTAFNYAIQQGWYKVEVELEVEVQKTDVSQFHTGRGWYLFPNDVKIKGKRDAEHYWNAANK
jgi:hypothetical protein